MSHNAHIVKKTYKLDQDERYRHHCNGCSVTVNTIMHDKDYHYKNGF